MSHKQTNQYSTLDELSQHEEQGVKPPEQLQGMIKLMFCFNFYLNLSFVP